MCMWFAHSSSWAEVHAITMRDFLVQTLSINESAKYSPIFLESNSENLSLTWWWSLVWLLHSESQNINRGMQKPFKSLLKCSLLCNTMRVSSDISSFFTTNSVTWGKGFSAILYFPPLIPMQHRTSGKALPEAAMGWVQGGNT